MTPEFNPMDPALEQAVAEIRDEAPDSAVVEAAAARVWARLSEAGGAAHEIHAVIRNCADFQALIPEFRAGRLSEARTALVRDHIHQCVACRHVYEGKVVVMPAAASAQPAVRRPNYAARWALAASVLVVAGAAIWWTVNQNGERTANAIVQSLDGALYTVTAQGIHPLFKGQNLPSDVELRTAKDSDAVLQLADGSQVEMRERSSLSTTGGAVDLTIRLGRGSVIVKARHRTQGHLYVDTGDCRVAVTGTLFEVTAGVKGSRVSVVEGEVHVTQDNQEKILHAGDQTATSANVEPEPVSRRNRLEPRSPDVCQVARSAHASESAGAALLVETARPPAGRHYVLREHPQSGAVPVRCRIGSRQEDGRQPGIERPVEREDGRRNRYTPQRQRLPGR